MPPQILIAAINAKYIHPSLGSRFLLANLGLLRSQARLLEFDLRTSTESIASAIAAVRPGILGLGVYVWNAGRCAEVLRRVRATCPDTVVVLGGPEVGFGDAPHPIEEHADYVIRGEADRAFADLCTSLLSGGPPPPDRIIAAPPPDPAGMRMAYDLYSEEDLAHRLVYVESSRGCPYHCEYCLSALDDGIREWPLKDTLAALDRLLARGARKLKFVDRTFNVSIPRCNTVLDFFLERQGPGLEIHFEMVPGRFPESLRERLRRFPAGMLRLEVGVQTFDEDVARSVRRPQDNARIEETFRFLRDETHALVHADLIAGLPGEDLASFGAGFDRLLALGPREIQVGLLKRLRGAPIGRHDESFGMVYDPDPPYVIRRTGALAEQDVERLDRFARYWERFVNRGRFPRTAPLLWEGFPSAFEAFLRFSDWLHAGLDRAHSIALEVQVDGLLRYLTAERGLPTADVAQRLWADYGQGGRRRMLPCLRPHLET